MTTTNQEWRHSAVTDYLRVTPATFNGDMHALWDNLGIADGPYNGRMLAWINGVTGATYTNVNSAMAAYADANGADNWSSMAGIAYKCLLDGVTGLYSVLSVVRLLSTYTGPLVRVRRAYDEDEQDFSADSTGRLNAADIADYLGGRTGYLAKIYDQTGNGRHAVATTTPTQSHAGMMESAVDSTGRFPGMFFGAQAPGQAYEVLLTTAMFQNVAQGAIVAVGRSTYNTSAANKNIASVVNNAAATRAQLSVGFSTTQFSAGGRRLDADSFDNNAGPTYDTDWHVFVARFNWGTAVQDIYIDASVTTDSTFQTAGNTSNTASATTANIGMGVSRQGGFFGGTLSTLVFARNADATIATLATALAPLKQDGGFAHTLSSQCTTTTGGQGFCGDGTNFWVAKSNGDASACTIYEIAYAGTAVTNFTGIVPHGQSVYFRNDTGNLMVGSYDSTGVATPKIQEMNKATGAAVRSWTLTGVGYGKGPNSCYYGAGQILFVTHPDLTFTGAPQVALININSDGTFSIANSWTFPVCLGQMQGMQFYNGHLYVIVDDDVVNASHANGTIYKLRLNSDGGNNGLGQGTISIVSSFPQMRAQGGEQEGLTYDGTNWYTITNADGANITVYKVTGIT